MREIKFSYICQHEDTGNMWRLDVDIQQIERGDFHIPRRIAIVARRQFTGLLDKNGKEIYESDIVKTHDGRVMAVRWKPERAWWVLTLPNPKPWDAQDQHLWYISDPEIFWGEVIGNVYEHPQLLEEG